ncbi:uroporphyrinogen decarboxylase family protein [Desulfuromonas thiophila]|uniref:[methyl-Co(III) methanol-specific corrinoid protein]:coenzyme M methyltransferase n=1 Tax=Desulfuromonas thiophila TaxID=57664 RepID=A0A1G6WX59_9BACT|nr:uroporphyrinogen decarboxylase family protein [Desulfuromonas thiophila]SDD69646.1 [methyl-Co(III) methanol-specific corrinoid protein]:coenzyme M methyltransferase [Desulfuromonas thiophila]
MTQKERLLRTLAGQTADGPPFICPGGMMTMIVTEVMKAVDSFWPEAHADAARMAALTLGTNRLTGIENLGLPFCMTVEAEAMGAAVDLGSKTSEPHVISYIMDELAQLDRLRFIDVTQGRAHACAEAIGLLKKKAPDVPIIANLSGPVSLATSLVDPLLYYRAIRRDKQAAHALNDCALQNALALGDALMEAGADAVCIADPSATGDLIGRRAFEEFVLPCLNRMAEHFSRRHNRPTIVHICGDVKSLGGALQQLSAAAVSVDSVVGIPQLRNLAPGKVSMGNISTFLLERGTPEKLARVSGQCLEQGVGILAPACGIAPGTPLKNLQAVSETVRHHRSAA